MLPSKWLHIMKIIINKEEVEVEDGARLGAVLAERGLTGPGTAVAVSNKLVPKDERDAFVLADGAQVVVIKAACGG